MTLASFNRKIARLGFQCYRGRGYFYFLETADRPEVVPPASVYTMRFADLPETAWLEIAGL